MMRSLRSTTVPKALRSRGESSQPIQDPQGGASGAPGYDGYYDARAIGNNGSGDTRTKRRKRAKSNVVAGRTGDPRKQSIYDTMNVQSAAAVMQLIMLFVIVLVIAGLFLYLTQKSHVTHVVHDFEKYGKDIDRTVVALNNASLGMGNLLERYNVQQIMNNTLPQTDAEWEAATGRVGRAATDVLLMVDTVQKAGTIERFSALAGTIREFLVSKAFGNILNDVEDAIPLVKTVIKTEAALKFGEDFGKFLGEVVEFLHSKFIKEVKHTLESHGMANFVRDAGQMFSNVGGLVEKITRSISREDVEVVVHSVKAIVKTVGDNTDVIVEVGSEVVKTAKYLRNSGIVEKTVQLIETANEQLQEEDGVAITSILTEAVGILGHVNGLLGEIRENGLTGKFSKVTDDIEKLSQTMDLIMSPYARVIRAQQDQEKRKIADRDTDSLKRLPPPPTIENIRNVANKKKGRNKK